MPAETFPLCDVVTALRSEILAAVDQAEGSRLKLAIQTVDMEFSVVVKKEGGGDGKLKFSVLGAGIEGGLSGKLAHEQIQRVKLTLKPSLTGGKEPLRDVEISRKRSASDETLNRSPR